MNKFKTHPQNKYTQNEVEQIEQVNEILKDFAAYIVLMLITVLGLMFLCTIN
jgi:hypothetical protein